MQIIFPHDVFDMLNFSSVFGRRMRIQSGFSAVRLPVPAKFYRDQRHFIGIAQLHAGLNSYWFSHEFPRKRGQVRSRRHLATGDPYLPGKDVQQNPLLLRPR